MPHQFSSYIMAQSILMSRSESPFAIQSSQLVLISVRSHNILIFIGFAQLPKRSLNAGLCGGWYEPASSRLEVCWLVGTGRGSVFPTSVVWNPFPAPASRLEHPVNTSKQIAETIKNNRRMELVWIDF